MPDLPQVSDQQGNLHQWQRDRIINTLIKESKLAYEIQGLPVLTNDEATKIASKVETIIKRTELEIVSGPMIREITNTILLKSGYAPYHSFCTRVGLPIYDAYYIDTGTEGHGDNANLIPNAETSHKRKADWISKEEALLLIPPELSALHKNADLHIHDLEYFTTRPFCSDWDARYFFYYGLTADGSGANASVAGPAKHAEVAILQLVKVLGSAQTNCAGGQGYYNFLTFIAPYLEGLYEDEIKQIMQMFVYEMTQMMVARGGQVVFSSVQLSPGVPKIWRDKPVVYKGKIYNGTQAPLRTYGEFEREVRIAFDTLMDVMLEGDYWGKPFSFPKPEISIEPCFIYPDETTLTFDKKNKDLPTYKDLYLKAFALASKHGTPYFDNQLPEYRGAGKGISCYQCVSEDTNVLLKTENGYKLIEIKDIKPEDEILTPRGPSSFERMFSKEYHSTLNKITTQGNRTILATDDHELWILRNGLETKVRASNLQISDKLKISTTLPETNKEIKDAMRKLNIKEEDINEFCYLMGIYCAEGNILIRPNKTGGSRLQISLNITETEYEQKITKILKETLKTKPKAHIIRNNEQRIIIYNKKLCKTLISMGVPEKTSHGWIPDFIFTASPEAKWNFLYAYYLGDGSIYKGKHTQISIYTVSKETAEGLIILLNSIGIQATKSLSKRNIYIINISKSDSVNKFLTGKTSKQQEYTPTKIKSISKIDYNGKVYDPVNIKGHEFITGEGLIIGNCCAYSFSKTLDSDPEFEDKLHFRDGKHFSMGSIQVVTLNLPRLAYRSNGDYTTFITEAKTLMNKCIDIFETKRKYMAIIARTGRMPFLTQRPRDPNTQQPGSVASDQSAMVYTIGIIGINEVVSVLTGKQLDEGQEPNITAIQIMIELNEYAKHLTKTTGINIAFARTPAETTAQRFAVADLMNPQYSEQAKTLVKGDPESALKLLGTTTDLPVYYTNGTHVPPNSKISLPDRIRTESRFFPLVDGGNICHIWLGEHAPDPRGLMDMTLNICKNTDLGYFAFTRDITVPKNRYKDIS